MNRRHSDYEPLALPTELPRLAVPPRGRVHQPSPNTESNRRPSPYHGDALPSELLGHKAPQAYKRGAEERKWHPNCGIYPNRQHWEHAVSPKSQVESFGFTRPDRPHRHCHRCQLRPRVLYHGGTRGKWRESHHGRPRPRKRPGGSRQNSGHHPCCQGGSSHPRSSGPKLRARIRPKLVHRQPPRPGPAHQ